MNIPQLLVAALKGFSTGGVVGAVKGVTQNDSFKGAFNAASQSVAAEDAAYQKGIADTNARTESKSNARAIARQASSIVTGETKLVTTKTESLGGGGFFGRNTAARTIEGIAQLQLNEAVRQTKAVEKSAQWLEAISKQKGLSVPR